MDNIQNLPNAGLEDVFDIQSLYSKMNTESSEERQKTLSALREKARRYLPETERTAKYLNALIEYKRLQLGLSVEEYAPLLGMPISAYQKAFLQPNVRFTFPTSPSSAIFLAMTLMPRRKLLYPKPLPTSMHRSLQRSLSLWVPMQWTTSPERLLTQAM